MSGSQTAWDGTERFEEPVFSAIIRPHRSLTRQGMRLVLILVCLTSMAASVPFVVLGYWPVAGFFGLDFLGLYIAFRINARQAHSFELLELTRIRLLLRKVSHRGDVNEWHFNPLWTRLHREEDDEYGVQTLTLASRGQQVIFARDLSPPERESLADDFGRALADVKRGY